MNRRSFLKFTAGSTAASIAAAGESPVNPATTGDIRKPLAIAMWDYSWILRHHRYGSFENWDTTLDQLAERGYNAIRLDAMPQYVAADTNGKVAQKFRSVKNGWTPALWGNDESMSFCPREALLEFLPLCRKYGIRPALATWFINHGTRTRGIFNEEGGLLRAWTETLAFLNGHQLLDNVVYVDLLNEYPYWHGYDCLHKQLDALSNTKRFQPGARDANLPKAAASGAMNPIQQQFYNRFANSLIDNLRARFPRLQYHFSLNHQMPLDQMDFSRFSMIDYHLWMEDSGRFEKINKPIADRDQSKNYPAIYGELLTTWREQRPQMTSWMDQHLTAVSATAKKNGIPWGNTEGWGFICWMDHPELNWTIIKEVGDVSVDLARKHGNLLFCCTSNFTHPQFTGLWQDVRWHRNITARIKA